MIDWNKIETVLFDMDGTLLDLHFDNYFWLDYVPQQYAKKHQITIEAAKERLLTQYQRIAGTLNWYCVDHWTQELGLDIALLKTEVKHLIQVHPHVIPFLKKLKSLNKQLILVTNAHQKSLALKMEETDLHGLFEQVISAHDLGLPKEDPQFWTALQKVAPFNKDQTLFIDDGVAMLESAKKDGIRWLMAILKPDSTLPANLIDDFYAVNNFSEVDWI